jgi:cellulose synthase/poly-beta-1,6-N-acetylglucosamine synthase-like glycosyltransferase/peptidoglycan/xylan/chitin deacetylase (PgdA/CDA1 family)
MKAIILKLRAAFLRRPLVWLIYAVVSAAMLYFDLASGLVFAAGVVIVRFMFTRRSTARFRLFSAVLVSAILCIGFLAALTIPTFHSGSDSLLIPSQEILDPDSSKKPGSFELTADVDSSQSNALNGVDQQAGYLSSINITGYYTGPNGESNYQSQSQLLLHAHLAETAGYLMVQNYGVYQGASGFSPQLAHAVLAKPANRSAFISHLVETLVSEHWDGVVLDFENIMKSDGYNFTSFAVDLRAALPSTMKLGIALPVHNPSYAPSNYFETARLSRIADFIDLMAYDVHVPQTLPGPVAPETWVSDAVEKMHNYISKQRMILGVAEYGYLWGPLSKKVGNTFNPSELRNIAAKYHAKLAFSESDQEWNAIFADGSVAWWSDEKSLIAKVKLARDLGLAGANVWELGGTDPIAGATKFVHVYRPRVATVLNRNLQFIKAKGLVALTFDDGPDPTWTPQILHQLERLKVPGTFFVIGSQAQNNPSLISREVNDGSVVGNHTFTHPDLSSLPLWLAKAQIDAGSWVIKGITGRSPLLFRSPYGLTDSLPSSHSTNVDLAKSMGLLEVHWNIDTRDWSLPGVKNIVAAAEKNPSHEVVILLHDGGGNRMQTVEALSAIVSHYRSLGFAFTTVDKMDGGVQYAYVDQGAGLVDVLSSLSAIAGFKLYVAAQNLLAWIFWSIAILSMIRLSFGTILARGYFAKYRDKFARTTENQISFSVIIPAHNEEATLVKTLNSVLKLKTYKVQIVIAENGSSDATLEVARKFALDHQQLDITVLECKSRGKANALNEAMQHCHSDVVIVIDADTVIDPDFCIEVQDFFNNPDVVAVAGNVKVGNPRTLLSKLQSVEYLMSLAVDRAAQAQLGIVTVVPGAAGAFRLSTLRAIGGWPTETLVEDTDLTINLHKTGQKIVYAPKAISYTETPMTLSEVVKQRSRWMYGTIQVAEKHQQEIFNLLSGRLGILGLPWLVLSQIVLPAIAPLVDGYLLVQILLGNAFAAISTITLSLAIEIIAGLWALHASKRSYRTIFMLVPMRFIWRPIMLYVATRVGLLWTIGRGLNWLSMKRTGTVNEKALNRI